LAVRFNSDAIDVLVQYTGSKLSNYVNVIKRKMRSRDPRLLKEIRELGRSCDRKFQLLHSNFN